MYKTLASVLVVAAIGMTQAQIPQPPQPFPNGQPGFPPGLDILPPAPVQPGQPPQPLQPLQPLQPTPTCQQGTHSCVINGSLFCLDSSLVTCVNLPNATNGNSVACLKGQNNVCMNPQFGPICIDINKIGCTAQGELFDQATQTLIDLSQPSPSAAPSPPPQPEQPPQPIIEQPLPLTTGQPQPIIEQPLPPTTGQPQPIQGIPQPFVGTIQNQPAALVNFESPPFNPQPNGAAVQPTATTTGNVIAAPNGNTGITGIGLPQ